MELTPEQFFMFMILAGTLALFAWGRFRYDIVAMGALLASVVAGVIEDPNQALSAFGHPAVVTVAAVLVISRGLRNSGVVDYIARTINPLTQSASTHVGTLTGVVTILSAFMNNVGALALLLPVALKTAFKRKRSPAILLMPLAFGSILGGLMTMIGTPPNIIIAEYRYELTGHAFKMFDFLPAGAAVALIGVVFVSLIGWRLLPDVRDRNTARSGLFEIHEYISQVKVPEKSPLVGKQLGQVQELRTEDVVPVGLVHGSNEVAKPALSRVIQANDILIVKADPHHLKELVSTYKLKLVTASGKTHDELQSENVRVAELLVGADSPLIGNRANYLRRRTTHRMNLLALAHRGRPIRQHLRNRVFAAGDVLLVQGNNEVIDLAVQDLRLVPLAERDFVLNKPQHMTLAVTIFAIAVGLSALDLLPVAYAFGAAILAYVALGIIKPRNLYRDIEWPIIVLIAAMIPIGHAFKTTGCADLVADLMLHLSG
jgi:di/tricarboxylate transporter